MTEEELLQTLAELPRHRAEEAFEQRVLRQLDEEAAVSRPLRGFPRWLSLAPVATGLLLVTAGLIWTFGHSSFREAKPPSPLPSQEIALKELGREARQLALELEQLRTLIVESEPVLTLSRDRTFGLLLSDSPRSASSNEPARKFHYPTPVRILPAVDDQL